MSPRALLPRSVRIRAAVPVSVVALTVPLALTGIALSPAAAARSTVPGATATTLTAKPGTTLDAGKNLRLVIRVRPAAAGTVTVTDGARAVATVKVVDGSAKVVLRARKGAHAYAATFTPKYPDRRAASASALVSVTGRAAHALPLATGAYGPLVTRTQQRLTWAGILVKPSGRFDKKTVAAVKRFQGKFFLPQTGVVNTRTMKLLTTVMLKKPPRACRDVPEAICVDKTRKIAQLVIRGKVKLSLDARFGSLRSPGLATREGIFSIQRKSADHVSSQFHTPMPYSMFFSGGQAVHYSQFFAAVGYAGASHGCVNIRDYKGVATMYRLSPIGTRVVVYRS